MTHFIFDCDDVLLDWQTGFTAYLTERKVELCPKGPQDWDLSKWIGCSEESARSWVQRFNASPDFSRLKAMEGAYDALWSIYNAGHQVTVLTSCGSSPTLRQARATNLTEVFRKTVAKDAYVLPISNLIILDLGEPKFMALYQLRIKAPDQHMVLVEDNFSHAQAGVANGIDSYCLRRSHNRQMEADNPDTGVIWVNDFAEMLDHISARQQEGVA